MKEKKMAALNDSLLGECYDVLSGKERKIENLYENNLGHVILLDCSPRLCPIGRTADCAIVEAARTSYGSGLKSEIADVALLHYLIRNKHWSPVEFVRFKFEIWVPIFVARQFFRHRMGNYCEYSLRYAKVKDAFYTPKSFRTQDSVNKQSSTGEFHNMALEMDWDTRIQTAKYSYDDMLNKGVCREQARCILPLATFTKFHVSMDLRNLFNFLSLRMDSHAQEEIRIVANAIYKLIEPIVPHAIEAWNMYINKAITLTVDEIEAIREKQTVLLKNGSVSEQEEFAQKLKLLGLNDF